MAPNRADRPRPQCLQRAARIRNDRHRWRADRDHRAALRIAQLAEIAGLGLRISRRQPDHPVQFQQLRATDPPRIWQCCIPRARARNDAKARRHGPSQAATRPSRCPLGGALRSRHSLREHGRGSPQCIPIPYDPQVSDAGLCGAGPVARDHRGLAMTHDWQTQLVQLVLVLILAPLLSGVTRKIKSRLLRRRGPSVIQPYRDLLKLIRKETVIADNASWLFRTAPYVIFATTWLAAALVPTFAAGLTFSAAADVIVIVALLGTARFFLALAGLDVGTSFGGIGSSREMMFASLAEPAMLLVVFTVSLFAGSTQLSSISAYMAGPDVGLNISLALALIALIIVSIAENARINQVRTVS